MPLENYTLIVEDNADDELLMLRALEKDRVKNDVVVVRDGAEALDFLFEKGAYEAREGGRPAVVFLDLKLPKIDGLEVLKQVRGTEATRTLPIVMLTSSDEDEDVIRSYDLGANSYVRKPVEFSAFMEAVGKLGLYWDLLNIPPVE